jgi:hypothetical protein
MERHSAILGGSVLYVRPERCQAPHIYIGMQGLKYMSKEEGIRGMFRGNWTNCVRIIPNSAVKFLMYEQLSRCA